MGLEEYGPEVKPLAKARRRLKRKEAAALPPKPKKPKAARVAQTAKARGTRLVDAMLTMPHYVNDKVYGPGPSKVPADLLPGLLETEQRIRENDANMFGQGRATFIGPNNRRMPVPASMFDSPMLNVLEAMTIS